MDKSDAKLKVLFVAAEVAPYAKSGGLGDVIGSLPSQLRKLGVDARVVLPKYGFIKQDYLKDLKYQTYFDVHLSWRNQSCSVHLLDKDVPTYFLENDYYFGRHYMYGHSDDGERFAFFSKAIIEMLPVIDFKPDIIHLNDWQTGMSALLIHDYYKKMNFFADIKTMYTIHNLQYQGTFPKETIQLLDLPDSYCNAGSIEFYGNISYMKAGLVYSDVIGTVSQTYADEIQRIEYGYAMDGVLRDRKDDLVGILNGIDYEQNNPETDTKIYKNFSLNNIMDKYENKRRLQEQLGLPVKNVPVISIVSRLASQKGFDIIEAAMGDLMREDIQLVVLGTGEGRYEHMLNHFAYHNPEKVSANIMFDGELAQKIYAGSDMFLMPSLFEPCGLGQIISMRYGTVPIVRKTGGLSDTVSHYNPELREGNGFVFENYDPNGLMWAIRQAINLYYKGESEWMPLVENAMRCDFSWTKSAKEYVKVYTQMIEKGR